MDMVDSFNEEDEVIQHRESSVVFIIDETSFGNGTLYVAESKLYWKNDSINQVVSIDYKSMCIFGTCNHPTVHEKPCMQIMVDFVYKPNGSILQNGNLQENHSVNDEDIETEGNEDEEEDEEIKSKIKLVPENPECLNEIYGAFTRVQPLHNINESDSDEEDSEFHYNEHDEFEDYDEDGSDQ
ncbi:Hypothetical protein CINCED_3A019185 [Cinara cedri]|uniref:Methylosome subunit pICln n=1 Tax=Cinara cedri TaxID=506608 RepID=A0A5E4M9U6_9HEMI|nr:Hypothetical protein CINCED_3A019185 [Cinara cedri]